jgi:uncharacterized protein YjaZ
MTDYQNKLDYYNDLYSSNKLTEQQKKLIQHKIQKYTKLTKTLSGGNKATEVVEAFNKAKGSVEHLISTGNLQHVPQTSQHIHDTISKANQAVQHGSKLIANIDQMLGGYTLHGGDKDSGETDKSLSALTALESKLETLYKESNGDNLIGKIEETQENLKKKIDNIIVKASQARDIFSGSIGKEEKHDQEIKELKEEHVAELERIKKECQEQIDETTTGITDLQVMKEQYDKTIIDKDAELEKLEAENVNLKKDNVNLQGLLAEELEDDTGKIKKREELTKKINEQVEKW